MHIELSGEQQALRDEVRAYFRKLLPDGPPEAEGEGMGSKYKSIIKQMGKDGWLGVGWPTEFGGHGRGPLEQLIFLDEASRAGAPIPMVTLNTVEPTLGQFGTDEQKEKFLPGILAGDI